MVDILVFSKDRAFQLHLFLDTLFKRVENIDRVFVQFGYSDEEYLNGYKKISRKFGNKVQFIDEQKFGFFNTLSTIVNYELKSDYLMIETDDSLFINDLDLKSCHKILEDNPEVGRYNYQLDYKLFHKNYDLKNFKDYFLIDKKSYSDKNNSEIALGYSFNVGGAISRTSDLKDLLTYNIVSHPIDLEIKGNDYESYRSYCYSILNKKESSTMIHLNNVLDRYEESFSTKHLNDLLIGGEVIDTDSIDFNSFERDLRWFLGENIGRFPIFPWEIPPTYHKQILKNRIKLL